MIRIRRVRKEYGNHHLGILYFLKLEYLNKLSVTVTVTVTVISS
jgi:hypothetical protein